MLSRIFLLTVIILVFCRQPFLVAQETFPVTGGESAGIGGTSNYTIGQVFYSYYASAKGSVAQGIQHPYEFFITTNIFTNQKILSFKVYPNPASGHIILEINEDYFSDCSFYLYTIEGKLLMNRKILDEISEIPLESLNSGIYLLRIVQDEKIVQQFKIIKTRNL